MKIKNLSTTIIGIGAIAGIRTFAAPAIVSNYLHKNKSTKLKRGNLNFMQTQSASTVLKIMALGEIFGDKFPFVPARIALPGLIGRGISGVLIGCTLAASKKSNLFKGGGLGFTSAIASAYLFYYLRKKLAENSGIPDPIFGLMEDTLVFKGSEKILG